MLKRHRRNPSIPFTSRPIPAAAGFTFVEVIVALILLGILAAFGVAKLGDYFHRQALVGEGKALAEYLREARAYGAKKGLQVGIVFNANAGSYTLFEDRNGNAAMDAGESVRAHALAKDIAFGAAVNGPGAGPDGKTVPANGLQGRWAAALMYPKDLAKGPDTGAAFLRQANLKTVTFAVQSIAGDEKFALSLWEGSAWRRL